MNNLPTTTTTPTTKPEGISPATRRRLLELAEAYEAAGSSYTAACARGQVDDLSAFSAAYRALSDALDALVDYSVGR